MAKQTENRQDEEFRLLEPDGKRPEQVRGEMQSYALPLPEQDRKAIEIQNRRRQRNRFTLSEIFVSITCICLMLALSAWLPTSIFALILGIATGLSLMGLFKSGSSSRLGLVIAATLVAVYFVTATVVMLRFYGIME